MPAGTRIFGTAFASTISATGPNFLDPTNPRPMVQLGTPGETGIAEISDMLLTVADILPGCTLLEINLSPPTPGGVALFNTHLRVGGARGSLTQTNCPSLPDPALAAARCRAAWALLHLTASSSAYVENMWGWAADHDLDGNATQTVALGRGALVESTQGTWLVGTGMEHAALYQYNFWGARGVYAAMQQSESPYWQGPTESGAAAAAPEPWGVGAVESDPGFETCADGDAYCRMAWFERVGGGAGEVFLYGGCVWVFFNGGVNGECEGENCQLNGIEIGDAEGVWLFGTNAKAVERMVVGGGGDEVATRADNGGGWGGVIAAYLVDA